MVNDVGHYKKTPSVAGSNPRRSVRTSRWLSVGVPKVERLKTKTSQPGTGYRDAVDPDRLRKGARVAKANLGRLEKRVSEAAHLDEGSVETLLEQLEAAWSAFAEVQDEILLFDDNQFNFDQEFEIRGEYEDRYIAIKSNLKEKLLNHRGRSSSHDVSSSSVSHSAKPDLKLPKIELPEFSGNYTEWPFLF